MKALKTLLVGAATFAAVVAAPALTAPAASDAAVDDTKGVKVMTVHGDRVAYRDEGRARRFCSSTVWAAARRPGAGSSRFWPRSTA